MVNEQPLRPARPTPGYAVFVGLVALVALAIGYALGYASRGAGTSTGASTQATTAASAAPTPAPTPIALSGQGSKVLPVDLQAGRYKVSWTAQGHDNFIVTVLGDNQIHVVNEIPPDPSSGETVLSVKDAATYQLQVQAATLNWTITLTRL